MSERLLSKEEYDLAVKRAYELAHAVPGTQEGDESDALVKAIVAYDEIHYPSEPISKEEMLYFFKEQGTSQEVIDKWIAETYPEQ